MTKHLLLVAMILAGLPFVSAADEPVAVDRIEQGRALAFERRKGNCLACHLIEGGELAGNYGPPLLMMKATPNQQPWVLPVHWVLRSLI